MKATHTMTPKEERAWMVAPVVQTTTDLCVCSHALGTHIGDYQCGSCPCQRYRWKTHKHYLFNC